jgi:hypothetical protein
VFLVVVLGLAVTSDAVGQTTCTNEKCTVYAIEMTAGETTCTAGTRGPVRKVVVGTGRVVVGTVKVVKRLQPIRKVVRVAVGVPLRAAGLVAKRVHERPLLRRVRARIGRKLMR